MNRGDKAKEYFRTGRGCSQSVALAFCDKMKLDPALVERQTIGFGAGMGRLREVCGTVSGMTYVLSTLYGDEGKASVYAMVQEAANEFKKQNGSIVCRELLGIASGKVSPPVPDARTPEYYKKRPCPELCKIAGDILETFIEKKESETKSKA